MSTEMPPEPENQETPPPSPVDERNEGSPVVEPEARTFGMLCHITALAGLIIPFGNIIGPLIIWLIKKDQYAFVDDQGRESLNFQITVTIAAVIAGLLVFIVIGIPLAIAVAIYTIVMVIIATTQANQGVLYRYPITFRFIK